MEDETLRQQFKALQEQQQKKLLKRKQRQEEKNKKKEPNGQEEKVNPPGDALGVTDDLGLMLSDPIPNNVLYDEELNKHLAEQIRELKDENGRLYKLLSERDYEIRKIKRQRDDDRDAIAGTGVASDTAATKIVELSKKNRELTAELGSEKTKSKQLLRKVRETEKEIQLMIQNGGEILNRSGSGKQKIVHRPRDETETEKLLTATAADLKSTQDKLSQTTNKMSDYRNQANSLKQELKVAHKVLSSELGEGVNIQALLNSPSGYRGRAQQILVMQKKISDLKSQLDSMRGRPGTEMSLEDQFMTMDVDGDTMSVTSGSGMMSHRSSTKSGSMDEKQRQRIRKLEKDKKEAKEKASEHLKVLEEEHGKLKEKWDASKARNKVLSNEVKTLKQQTATLKDKGKHDNELIEALLSQQSHLKDMLEETSTKTKEVRVQQEQADLASQQKNQQESNMIEQLKRIASEKEQKVHQLEEEITQMKNMLQQGSHMNGHADQFILHPAHRPPSGHERPMTVVSITDRPPSGERHSGMSYNSPTPPPGSRQSVRPNSIQGGRTISPVVNGRTPSRGGRPSSSGSVSNGGASSAQIDELTRQLYEFKATSQAAEVERDKLLELVQMLQQRVDESNNKSTDIQAQLQQLKQQNVMLEKQLGRAQMSDGGKTSGKGTRKQQNSASLTPYSSKSDDMLLKEDLATTRENVDELQTRLILQLDENHALKSALQSSMKAKEEDLKLYHAMMKQTKQVFLQGLRQFKQTNQNS